MDKEIIVLRVLYIWLSIVFSMNATLVKEKLSMKSWKAFFFICRPNSFVMTWNALQTVSRDACQTSIGPHKY